MEKRNYIYICKGISIFSVAAAHVSSAFAYAGEMEKFCVRLLSSLGTIGVPLFFLISGYLYEKSLKKHDWKYIVKSKLEGLCIPWMINGTIVWLYVVLRKGGISFKNWLYFLIGIDSYLYFMFVLVILYMLYVVMRKNKFLFYVGIFFSVISYIYINIFGKTILFSPYLNVIGWQGWFLVGGGICCKESYEQRMLVFIKKWWSIGFMIAVTLALYICYKEETLTYWHKSYIWFELASLMFLGGLAYYLLRCEKIKKMLICIGKNSFSIYLFHMPVAGIISNIMNRFPNSFLVFLRPFIVVGMTLLLIKLGDFFFERLGLHKYYKLLIGER